MVKPGWAVCGLQPFLQGQGGLTALAQVIYAEIGGDPPDPGGEGAAQLEGLQPCVRPLEGLLSQVRGIFGIS